MSAPAEAILNQAAWEMVDASVCQDVVRLLEEACGGVRVTLAGRGRDIAHLAREALERGSPMIIAGGGDGTVSAVASVLAGTDAVLGVLPVGTLNHFAKDLGIPADLGEAARILATGRAASVDTGEVGGRIFINNSALGLYPEIVALRVEGQRRGFPKWLASFRGLVRAMAHYRLLTVKVVVDGHELVRTTPLVFVGNNRYVMEGFGMGSRESLDRGELSLVIPHYTSRLRLLLFSLHALLGHGPDHGLDLMAARELRIESHHQKLLVSIDGELARMPTPLTYLIRKGNLRVIVPGRE